MLYMNTSESNLLPVSGSAAGVLTCTPNKYREQQQGHVTDLTTLARCLAGFASHSEKLNNHLNKTVSGCGMKEKVKYIESVLLQWRKGSSHAVLWKSR